jgi:hypothetical protein
LRILGGGSDKGGPGRGPTGTYPAAIALHLERLLVSEMPDPPSRLLLWYSPWHGLVAMAGDEAVGLAFRGDRILRRPAERRGAGTGPEGWAVDVFLGSIRDRLERLLAHLPPSELRGVLPWWISLDLLGEIGVAEEGADVFFVLSPRADEVRRLRQIGPAIEVVRFIKGAEVEGHLFVAPEGEEAGDA